MARAQTAWRWTRGYVEDMAATLALAVEDERARMVSLFSPTVNEHVLE